MYQGRKRVRVESTSEQEAAGPSRSDLMIEFNAHGREVTQRNDSQANTVSQNHRRRGQRNQSYELRCELRRQKSLKEMYINREKETRRELERLKKYSDPESLNTFKIATQVRDTTKRKKKKLLQVDYEELQVSHIINENKYSNELQREKNKSQLLQKNLESVTASFNEVNARYQTDVTNIRQQTDALQHDLDNEVKQKQLLQTNFEELQVAYSFVQEKFRTVEDQLEKTHLSLYEVSLKHQTDVIDARTQVDNLQLQNNILQSNYDKLYSAYTLSQQKFSAELDAEKQKNNSLQQELDMIRVSHSEIKQKYDTDVVTVRQQAETLQLELDKQIKSQADTVSQAWRTISVLKAEQDALRQKMAEEVQQNALEKERILGRELEELKAQLNQQISRNLELSTELEAEREGSQFLLKSASCGINYENETTRQEVDPMEYNEVSTEQQATISPASASTSMEEAQGSEGNLQMTTNTPSAWKRTRHLLGLRKPERWKRRRPLDLDENN